MAVRAPADIAAKLETAEGLRKSGDFAGALLKFGEIVIAYEANQLPGVPETTIVQAYVGFARSAVALARYQPADTALEKAASRFDDPELHARRGFLLDDLGRHEAACDEYARAEPQSRQLAASTTDPEVVRRYGRLLNGLGRRDEAHRQFEGARKLYEAAGGLRSHDPDFLSGFAYVLDELNAHSEAVDAYARALNVRPGDYIALYNKAVVLDNLADPKRAEEAYRAALKFYPDDSDCNAGLGWVLGKLGRYVEARISCEKALTSEATNAAALLGLGFAQAHLGERDKAEQAYRESLDLDPHNADTLCNLAGLLNDLDRPEEAEPPINEAVELDPTWQARATQAAIEVRLADKYHDDDLYRDAIDHVRLALQARKVRPAGEDPEGAKLELVLSSALVSLGEYSSARAALTRARKMTSPTSGVGLKATRNLRRLQDSLRATIQVPRWVAWVVSALAVVSVVYGIAFQGLRLDSAGFVGFVLGMVFVIFAAFCFPAITRLKIGPAELEKASGVPILSGMDKS